ncbi:hypothetical protein NUW58_g5108 [Xylaria curta]|uniref:Uncharacterized protein n=1 Tax=Xylaria curta TaxID=42375 RepID=A0ACC1P685_9PEZI|nr:hypothetical protein NUW58_g5108 [Xylaria curta]
MAHRVLPFPVAALLSLTECSPTPVTAGSTTTCNTDITSLSWKITDFEWRTGYHRWSYYVGVGPAPPPPPTQFYNCGQAMLRMNITVVGANTSTDTESVVSCVEQTNDAKLANITDMAEYNAGPWGPPPPSPHWFTCDMDHQLFIFPGGVVDPWANANLLTNPTTQIRMDPVRMTLEVGQSWACDNGEPGSRVEVTGIADLPPLTCRGRSNLEPDANFLINSPVMHGPGLGAQVRNGSVCTGLEFFVKAYPQE